MNYLAASYGVANINSKNGNAEGRGDCPYERIKTIITYNY
jgi:hypothetical protein